MDHLALTCESEYHINLKYSKEHKDPQEYTFSIFDNKVHYTLEEKAKSESPKGRMIFLKKKIYIYIYIYIYLLHLFNNETI